MSKMEIPKGMLNKIKKLPELSKMSDSFPSLEKSGPGNGSDKRKFHLLTTYQF